MKTIFLDGDYKCHVAQQSSKDLEVTTDYFDGKDDYYIESHRYIPAGHSWNGEFGLMIYPWRDTKDPTQPAEEPIEPPSGAPMPKAADILTIAKLEVVGADLQVVVTYPFADGEEGAILQARFDNHWSDLDICCVMVAGTMKRTVDVTDPMAIVVPPEVLAKPFVHFEIGFSGYSKDGHVKVITTPTLSLGRIQKSFKCHGDTPYDPPTSTIEKIVGKLSDLKTRCKDTIVCAINEVYTSVGSLMNQLGLIRGDVYSLKTDLGNKSELTTRDKTSAVKAINELDAEVGDLTGLHTVEQTNLVDAINEVKSGAGVNRVFDIKADMEAWIKENSASLRVGDNLYILEKDTPDYWWDGKGVQILETQKVDMSELIDDSKPSGTKMYSSSKTASELRNLELDVASVVTFKKLAVATPGKKVALNKFSPLLNKVELQRVGKSPIESVVTVTFIRNGVGVSTPVRLDDGHNASALTVDGHDVYVENSGPVDIHIMYDTPIRDSVQTNSQAVLDNAKAIDKNAQDILKVQHEAVKIEDETVSDKAVHSSLKTNTDYANAPKNTVQGEVINLDDVSPLEHELKCTVSGVPYLEAVSVVRCGLNFLPQNWKSRTIAGITFTVSDDGTISTSGISTDVINYRLDYLGGKYTKGNIWTFSGCPAGGSNETFYIGMLGYTSMRDFGDGFNNKHFPNADNAIVLTIKAGVNMTGKTFRPMMTFGKDKKAFEPYTGDIFKLSPSGIVSGMTSLSPNITILTDTPGALIKAVYNQDMSKFSGGGGGTDPELVKRVQTNTQAILDINMALDDKLEKTPIVDMTSTTATITPGNYYKWGEVAELALTLSTPSEWNGKYAEFMFEFKSGVNPTVVTGLDSITWPGGFSIAPNRTYQVSIVNGVGVAITDIPVEKADVIRVIDMTETTATLLPNTFYKWGEVAELNITLGSIIPNKYSEFMFEFKSGEVATVITGLESVKWLSGYKVEPNKTYQVSILNGIGVIGGV